MSEPAKIDKLAESLKQYVNTNYELIKLEATERSSVIGSGIASSILIGIVGILFLSFASLFAGFYLSAYYGNTYIGFAIVAGAYLVIGLILLIGRKSLVEKPIRDSIIRKVYSKNEPS
jgi:hypothetical protein